MSRPTHPSKRAGKRNGLTVVVLLAVVAGMGGLAYASVPLYQLFCRVTGYGGTPQIEAAGATTVSDKTIKVRFDSNIDPNLKWQFKPAQREVTVRLGEQALAFYVARNLSDQTTTGTASFNVTPYKAGPYFSKVDCFCFTEQTLKPGEEAEMPVTFFVDPEILDDSNADEVKTITLSYTFYPNPEGAEEEEAPANTAQAPSDGTNG